MSDIEKQMDQEYTKGRITVKMVLTEHGQTRAMLGNTIPLIGEWVAEYNRSKRYYLDQGYTLISEDIEKGEFTVEK